MKKYTVEYKNAKVAYTAQKIEAVARELGHYEVLDEGARDGDYLSCAVALFCETHFMWAGAAHCESVDAETRGDKTRAYKYQPNGAFAGWINATTEESQK